MTYHLVSSRSSGLPRIGKLYIRYPPRFLESKTISTRWRVLWRHKSKPICLRPANCHSSSFIIPVANLIGFGCGIYSNISIPCLDNFTPPSAVHKLLNPSPLLASNIRHFPPFAPSLISSRHPSTLESKACNNPEQFSTPTHPMASSRNTR